MHPWVAERALDIARHAERDLEALVAVSTPSGDVRGAEEAVAVATALLPAEARVERPPCSTPGYARDLLARLEGTGSRRIVMLGHLDTVVASDAHRPLERAGDRLVGSGTIDMKGGDVLALGVLRALAQVPDRFREVALLLVNDEEWRTQPFAHTELFLGWDACLCFEAGERTADGGEGVVVRRKAAATVRVSARGVSAHSGSAPDRGRNALLALADAARAVAACHAPAGSDRLSAVPTILRSGDAFNVVPAGGELYCDLRADRTEAFQRVLEAVPPTVDGVAVSAEVMRLWPGMDAREATAPALARASQWLGRTVAAVERGGASDASHLATAIPVTVDGLGPRGGGAHTPEEWLLADSLRSRAEVALAVVAAVLG